MKSRKSDFFLVLGGNQPEHENGEACAAYLTLLLSRISTQPTAQYLPVVHLVSAASNSRQSRGGGVG